MNIKSNERVTVIGQTGSGKSVLVKKACQQFKKIIFFDPKLESYEAFKDFCIVCNSVEEVLIAWDENNTEEEFFILYQPHDLNEEIFNRFCKEIFKRGNIILVMDECYFVCYPQATEWHQKLIRMGRSKNIGLWHITQRPMYVDNFILSEAEHFFIFRLQMPGDKKKVGGIIGEEAIEKIESLKEFEFIYYNFKEGAQVYEPLEDVDG